MYRPHNSVSLEFSNYSVGENIRSDHFALQICTIAEFIRHPVRVSMNVLDGSAEGNFRLEKTACIEHCIHPQEVQIMFHLGLDVEI